jgi:signal transduction histidine kinase/CheY-like chemotaxis protein/HPt (histidine-containing phosphotransfer) domain-containing protein
MDALLHVNNIHTASVTEIANFILEQGIALTQSKIGFVGFLGDDEAAYTFHAVSKNVMKDCRVTREPMQWRITTAGIWADAIRERRVLFVNDYSQPHPSKKGLPAGHTHLERFMVVPLFEGEKVVAIAGVGNKATAYDASDERQMILLLGGMFHCVQRQRDRKALQEAHKELEQRVEQRTAEFAAAKAAAEAANRAKSEFLANISHELRTPMNAILNFVDLALPKQGDPTAADFLRTAKESAELLLALLNDLLDTAKIESGKLEIESAPFNLRRLIDQAAGILSVRASIKGISFFWRISPEVPEIFVGDQVRLRQVIFNLSSNAIKFTEQGQVDVTVHLESQDMNGACLRFEIRDTGIGIKPEDLERIFYPFAQADLSTARRFGGTGLGLTISSSLVGLMGGRIWAESESGKGSTFYFTVLLPVGQKPADELRAPEIALEAASKLNILLVEDHLPSQKLATYILEERGHAVEVAGSGQQALILTQGKLYDVILMDLQMPDMSGAEATAAIRALEGNRKRVPIIAMTAYAMQSDRERCLAAGMDGYLAKPIHKNELIATVEKFAGNAIEGVGQETYDLSRPEPSMPSKVPAFDADLALKRCYNQPRLLQEMIEYFSAEVDSFLSQMHSALEECDWNTFGRLGHRLKGTLVYLGADSAMNAAQRVESFEQHSGSGAEAHEAFQALERQCAILKAILSAQDRMPESQKDPTTASSNGVGPTDDQ